MSKYATHFSRLPDSYKEVDISHEQKLSRQLRSVVCNLWPAKFMEDENYVRRAFVIILQRLPPRPITITGTFVLRILFREKRKRG